MDMNKYYQDQMRHYWNHRNKLFDEYTKWHTHLSLIGASAFAILVTFPDHTNTPISTRVCFLSALVFDILGVLLGLIRLYGHLKAQENLLNNLATKWSLAMNQRLPLPIVKGEIPKIHSICGRVSVVCYVLAVLFLLVYETLILFFPSLSLF